MKVIPEKRSELLQALRAMTQQIKRERGCNNCYFFQDVENENIFMIIEDWKTQEELDSHLESDMFGALIGTKSLLVEPVDISIKAVSYTAGMEAVKKAREERRDLGKEEEK
jgi:quinol monooxygenase YgiN